jgi:2-phosphosulfolactate phosphatase
MSRVQVVMDKRAADPQRFTDSVAIVVDLVFATSGIAIALERGAADIIPTLDIDGARAYASTLAPGSFILTGEQDGEVPTSFIAPWPCVLLEHNLAGKRIVYSTTNGTVALKRVAHSPLVLAFSLLNASAVARYVCAHHDGRDVIIVCAGSGPSFSLEDFYGAGCLVSLLLDNDPGFELSDAARAARFLHDGANDRACLEESYAGRMMSAMGLHADLAFCRQRDVFHRVPILRDGRISCP